MSDAVPAKPKGKKRRRAKPKRRPRVSKLPPWHVVLLDDNQHTYQYVIEMLAGVFGYDPTKGFQIACEVDSTGRAILLTTHREHAELKRDQVLAYGADARISTSRGSMRAVVEPAG